MRLAFLLGRTVVYASRFVVTHGEPTLRSTFCDEYDAYQSAVNHYYFATRTMTQSVTPVLSPGE
jgi:protein-S-isoprenylcysteine O-methyltransferase Ste14